MLCALSAESMPMEPIDSLWLQVGMDQWQWKMPLLTKSASWKAIFNLSQGTSSVTREKFPTHHITDGKHCFSEAVLSSYYRPDNYIENNVGCLYSMMLRSLDLIK